MKRSLQLALLLLPLLSACRKDSAPLAPAQTIYQSYSVEYDQQNQHTVCTAAFLGKDGALPSGATAYCNSRQTAVSATSGGPQLPGNGYTYHYMWDDPFLEDVEFKLKTGSNQIYLNNITQDEIQNVNFDPGFDTLSRGSGTTLTFLGGGLATGENIMVYIQQGSNYSIAQFETTEGSENITIPASALAGLANGPATAVIKRFIHHTSLSQADSKGGEYTVAVKAQQNIVLVN